MELQIDSLEQFNENLIATHSYLFDKALNLEESDKETVISNYRKITENKQEDFYWLFNDILELFQ